MGAIDAVIYPQEEHMFEYNGINYGKYLSEKVNIGFQTHMLQMVSQSHNLKYLLEDLINVSLSLFMLWVLWGLLESFHEEWE